MKRIISFIIAAVMMLACLSSCQAKNNNGEKTVDLSKFVVARTENFEIDGAMYAYFLYDWVGQYSYYLSFYGYDLSLTLTEQTGECTIAEGKTWFEFFSDMANSDIEQYLSLAEAALEAGMTLTGEEIAEMDAYIEELTTNALESGYASLDEMIAEYYIEGVDAAAFRRCMELEQLAYNYMLKYQASLEYTEDELLAYREAHPDEFITIDYIEYTFYAEYNEDATDDEKSAAYADAKNNAERFLNENVGLDAIKNAIVALENEGLAEPYEPEEIISSYTTEDEYYSTEGAEAEETKAFYEWAYSSERNTGDTYMLEGEYDGEKYYTVFCIISPEHIDDYLTKDCRHILFYVDYETEDEDELNAAIADASAKANAILEEFNNGEKTQQAFIDLENRCLEDESALEATIYENVVLGYMVPEFEAWIYDESRVSGDIDIVKTDYGFHLVYFIGDGVAAWKTVAKEALADETMMEYFETIMEKHPVEYDEESLAKIP